jgi:hypothetical protein
VIDRLCSNFPKKIINNRSMQIISRQAMLKLTNLNSFNVIISERIFHILYYSKFMYTSTFFFIRQEVDLSLSLKVSGFSWDLMSRFLYEKKGNFSS